jgi:hypothetical protein
MSDFRLRAAIAVAALGLGAVKLFRPEMKVDLTLLAFLVIAALALFGPRFRVKGLDLGGFKVEFPEPKAKAKEPAPAAPLAEPEPPGAVRPVAGDSYVERFVKLAPTEMIGAYAVIMAMVKSPSNSLQIPQLPWIVFAIFLVVTPLYFQRVLRVGRFQSMLTAVTFAAWALILPGPFASIPHYDPLYGALAFVVVSMLLPIVVTGAHA